MAAVMSKDVAFIVLMAGTGMTGEEIIDLQSRLVDKADGIPEEKTEEELSRVVCKKFSALDGIIYGFMLGRD